MYALFFLTFRDSISTFFSFHRLTSFFAAILHLHSCSFFSRPFLCSLPFLPPSLPPTNYLSPCLLHYYYHFGLTLPYYTTYPIFPLISPSTSSTSLSFFSIVYIIPSPYFFSFFNAFLSLYISFLSSIYFCLFHYLPLNSTFLHTFLLSFLPIPFSLIFSFISVPLPSKLPPCFSPSSSTPPTLFFPPIIFFYLFLSILPYFSSFFTAVSLSFIFSSFKIFGLDTPNSYRFFFYFFFNYIISSLFFRDCPSI